MYIQRFEWDEEKDIENQRKHGISLEVAALVFDDKHCLIVLDHIDIAGEQRWHAIGAVQVKPNVLAVLMVVHVYREDSYGEEIIRIISARAAEKHDIRRYQEQEVD